MDIGGLWNRSDFFGFIFSTAALLGWLFLMKTLVTQRFLTQSASRKWLHIVNGITHAMFGPCFSAGNSGRFWCLIGPLLVSIHVAIVGLGWRKDEEMVRSMSRTGNRQELLRGPLIYTLVALSSLFFYYRNVKAYISCLLLFAGDGFAGLVGAAYGKKKLPWNRDKSYVGSLSFIVAAMLSSAFFIEFYNFAGIWYINLYDFLPSLLITVLVGALVESLPGQSDWDNLTVSLSGFLTLVALGW